MYRDYNVCSSTWWCCIQFAVYFCELPCQTWASVDPLMSPFGVTRPQWVNFHWLGKQRKELFQQIKVEIPHNRGQFDTHNDRKYHQLINSLAAGKFKLRLVIFKPIFVNGGWGISYEIALRWMPRDLTDDMWILVQVMAWCRQATSHYLSQSWPRSMSPNGVTKPQWLN